MFTGRIDLGNGTGLDLVIVPLKGSTLQGQWEEDTDLLMLCDVGNARCCTCSPNDHPNRYTEKLALSTSDAEGLANWFKTQKQF